MTLKRRLRGYGKSSEKLMVQYSISNELLPLARQLIGDTPNDPELFDPHAMTPAQVRIVADAIGCSIDSEKYDFYLEAEEDWLTVAEMRDAVTGP